MCFSCVLNLSSGVVPLIEVAHPSLKSLLFSLSSSLLLLQHMLYKILEYSALKSYATVVFKSMNLNYCIMVAFNLPLLKEDDIIKHVCLIRPCK